VSAATPKRRSSQPAIAVRSSGSPDQLDPARGGVGLPVVEPRERVLRETGEHGGELHG